jgi:hypothetical protein
LVVVVVVVVVMASFMDKALQLGAYLQLLIVRVLRKANVRVELIYKVNLQHNSAF